MLTSIPLVLDLEVILTSSGNSFVRKAFSSSVASPKNVERVSLSHSKQLVRKRGLHTDFSRTSPGVGNINQKPKCWEIPQTHHYDLKQSHSWFMLLHSFLSSSKDFYTKTKTKQNLENLTPAHCTPLPCLTPQSSFLTFKFVHSVFLSCPKSQALRTMFFSVSMFKVPSSQGNKN